MSILKKNLFLSSFFSLITFGSLLIAQTPQGIIVGRVFNSETLEPIQFATVFLSFTSKGTLTNEKGEFTITNIPKGRYETVCSLVGYKRSSRNIEIKAGEKKQIEFLMQVSPTQLNEVNVVELEPSAWKRALSIFKREFLGQSTNGANCEILNPEVLDLQFAGYGVIGSSSQPLVILNKSLGYKITLSLISFVWSSDGVYGSTLFSPYFEELVPTRNDEKIEWEKNRKKAYSGSFRHFLSPCAKGYLYEQGYRIIKRRSLPREIEKQNKLEFVINHQSRYDLDTMGIHTIIKLDEETFSLETEEFLDIIYLESEEEWNYQFYKEKQFNSRALYSFQRSFIKLPEGSLEFDEDGKVVEDGSVNKLMVGYWAWKRVGDLLPYDYELPNEN